MLDKTEWAMKNTQSRETIHIGHNTQSEDGRNTQHRKLQK